MEERIPDPDARPRAVEASPVQRAQVLPAGFDDDRIDLYQDDFADTGIPQHLSKGETIAPSGDQYPTGLRVKQKRGKGEGLVVNELVHLKELNVGVEKEPLPVFRDLGDGDVLELRPLPKDPRVGPEKNVSAAMKVIP